MLEETAQVLLSLSNKSASGKLNQTRPDGYPRGPASPGKLSISFLLDGPSSDTNTAREALLAPTAAQKSPSNKKRTHDSFEFDKPGQSASLPSKKPRPDVTPTPPVPSLPLELVLALQLGILPTAVSPVQFQQAPLATASPMIFSPYLPYIQGPPIQMLPMTAQQLPRYQPIKPNAHLASSSPASSYPSSPVTEPTGTRSPVTTRREKTSDTSEATAEATEPNVRSNSDSSSSEPSDRPQVVDTQQHTQQLLRQWHRQRQVQKLLYIQKKSQKKQKSDISSPTSYSGSPPAFKPAFTSAAPGSPSSLTPEALMALVEDLLARHLGPEMPASDRRKPAQKNNEKERGKRRHRVPPEHLQVLEEIFAAEPFPHAEAKLRLAERLGMTKRGITIWFQNKRARLKRNDEELKAAKASQQEGASGTGRKSDGIVFHQLTVDDEGQLTIIPEYPLE